MGGGANDALSVGEGASASMLSAVHIANSVKAHLFVYMAKGAPDADNVVVGACASMENRAKNAPSVKTCHAHLRAAHNLDIASAKLLHC